MLNSTACVETGLNSLQIQNMLRASLISKNEKQFEKILQSLNEKERTLFKMNKNTDSTENDTDNDNMLVDYFLTNMKEMKWKKGERLFSAFVDSL